MKHSLPNVVCGYGGWLTIRNLPLDYWCRKTFEAIGDHFEGLEAISVETLNHTNVAEAIIQVKRNLCGFIPSMIEIADEKCGTFFLNYGDIEVLCPPPKVKGDLLLNGFF